MLPSAQHKMQRVRVQVGALIAVACACTASSEHPAGVSPGAGITMNDEGGTASTRDATGDRRKDAALDAPFAEAAIRDDRIVIVLGEAGPARTACTGDVATLGSSRLAAGGSTPPSFADAYNSEVMSLDTPGPFLLVLHGVNGPAPDAGIAEFGALGRTPQGAVTFAGGRAAVPFSMNEERRIDIAAAWASFDLSFGPSTGSLPIAAVQAAGTLADACSSLSVSTLRLLVPKSASDRAFHGSKVSNLMGPAQSWGNASDAGWALELAGTAQEVYAVGFSDGGVEP
jgi:hypothetical protein